MASSLQHTTMDNTVGAVFVGIAVSSFVFGITALQAYTYYHRYPNDSLLHKLSVAILWTLDAFHLILCTHATYVCIVTGFGDITSLTNIVWSLRLEVAVNVLIVLVVQILYAYRVWLLGGYLHGFLGHFVAAAVAGGLGMGIVLAYKIYTINTLLEIPDIAWAINGSLGTTTALDFVIAGAMCYYLRKSKGIQTNLNSRISKLMQYTLCSGLLTSACSLSAMFSHIFMPNTFIVVALGFLLTKIYVCSFLAMLNSRQRTRRPSEEASNGIPRHLPKLRSVSFRSYSLRSAPAPSAYAQETVSGDKSYPWR